MNAPRLSQLSGLPQQFDMRTADQKWQGAFKEAQQTVREQGQVMSAALANNGRLWETNKRLRKEQLDLLETCARLEHERNELQAKLDAIPADVQERAALQAENAQLRQAHEWMSRELAASMYPELSTEKRREFVGALQQQSGMLDFMQKQGLLPTPEELAREDHALPGVQQAPFKLGGR